jgi:hypothetical protein
MTEPQTSQSGGGLHLIPREELERALAAAQSLAFQRDREISEIADWLQRQGFPYDWSTVERAPACLLVPLAEAWADAEGQVTAVEDYMGSMQEEQEWAE